MCGFAGIERPEGIDAVDLAPIWEESADSLHEVAFLPFLNNQRAISDRRWKLHVYPRINHLLLFDLETDPHELNNLAEDPEQGEHIARLTLLMRQQQTLLGDTVSLCVDNPQPMEPDYDNAKRVLDMWQPKWIREKYFEGRDNPNHGGKKP